MLRHNITIKKLHLTFLCKIESLYMDQPKPKKKIHYFSVFRVIPQNEEELISKAPLVVVKIK